MTPINIEESTRILNEMTVFTDSWIKQLQNTINKEKEFHLETCIAITHLLKRIILTLATNPEVAKNILIEVGHLIIYEAEAVKQIVDKKAEEEDKKSYPSYVG